MLGYATAFEFVSYRLTVHSRIVVLEVALL